MSTLAPEDEMILVRRVMPKHIADQWPKMSTKDQMLALNMTLDCVLDELLFYVDRVKKKEDALERARALFEHVSGRLHAIDFSQKTAAQSAPSDTAHGSSGRRCG